jgi:lysozyme family protein
MQGNFDACLKEALKHEGGYVDHPKDPGGATNLGVTKQAWEDYVGHEVTKDDIKALTPDVVKPFYLKRYWNVCRCDDLPSGVDYVVFDIAVNSGPGRAAKFLQSAVGATADGRIGPVTLASVDNSALSTRELIDIICNRRQKFWESLPTFGTFGRGWTRRGEEVRKKALEMAA